MSKPVNLNRFRKDKARADRKARAKENAVKFGRTKSAKTQDAAQADRLDQHLDNHKRDE